MHRVSDCARRHISVGALWPRECVACSADEHNALAILARHDRETLDALLRRLDQAIAKAYDGGDFTNEEKSAPREAH